VENDEAFYVDRPVALVINESLNQFQQSLRSRDIWMRSFKASEKV